MNSLPVRTWNMRRRAASCLAVLVIAAFAGCGKKHAPPPPAASGAAPTATISATPDNINPGDKVFLTWKTTDATAHVTVGGASSTGDLSGETVDDATFHTNVTDLFFDYDSYDINPQSQTVISKDAAFLASHPKLKIIIGGYCDARGSTEYNLALGENRANAAKQALVSAGVNPDRIRTVSYGKEKQFCTEANEQCYQQNRRAGFSVDR